MIANHLPFNVSFKNSVQLWLAQGHEPSARLAKVHLCDCCVISLCALSSTDYCDESVIALANSRSSSSYGGQEDPEREKGRKPNPNKPHLVITSRMLGLCSSLSFAGVLTTYKSDVKDELRFHVKFGLKCHLEYSYR